MTEGQAVGQIAQNPGEEQSEGEIAPGILVILFSQEQENHRDQGSARQHDKKRVVVFERTKSRAGVCNIYQIEPARNDLALGFAIDVMQNPILADLIERIERQRKGHDPLHITPPCRQRVQRSGTSLGAQTASLCFACEAEGRAPVRLGRAEAYPSGALQGSATPRSRARPPPRVHSTSSLHFCDRRDDAFAAIAQIGMGRTLADSFAMAPATRTFCIRRFLDNGGGVPRIFDNEVA